jgi:hypothetical protein
MNVIIFLILFFTRPHQTRFLRVGFQIALSIELDSLEFIALNVFDHQFNSLRIKIT